MTSTTPDEISQAARERATGVLDVFLRAFDETGNLHKAFAAGLAGAGDSFRDQADRVAERRTRGWQSTSKELIAVAARVAGLAAAVNALEPPAIEPAAEPAIEIDANSNANSDADQLMDYLRGDSDTLPDIKAVPSLISMDKMSPLERIEIGGDTPGTSPLNQEAKAMTDLTFPIDGNPFIEPTPPSTSAHGAPSEWVDKHRYSFTDLLTPIAPPADLQHWSWSQLTTAENCGVQYRATRLEGLPQVPQWANIGGTSFHLASEAFDRIMAAPGNPAAYEMRNASGDVLRAALTESWNEVFAAEIARVAAESFPMGEDGTAWRASSSGKEGYTWWLHEGADMLCRYADLRLKLERAGDRRRILDFGDKPMIELEHVFTVAGPLGSLAVKIVFDRVWLCADGTALVVDLKTGARKADDGQLGLAGWALRSLGWTGPIRATFYDARKGIFTPEIDPREAHPWEEWVYRFHAAEARRLSGLYQARRSDFCGGCSVRYACPVGG